MSALFLPDLPLDSWIYILVAAALIILNAFFVLAEFSIVKVRHTRIEMLARQGAAGAERVRRILERTDAYLSACQLGITLASLGVGWLGEPAVGAMLEHIFSLTGFWSGLVSHTLAFGIAFVLISSIHIILGELAPKLLAIRRPERMALALAVPLNVCYYVFLVPLWLINRSAAGVLKLLRLEKREDSSHSEEELRVLLSRSESHGVLPLHNLLLFENLFDFGTLTVRDAMQPIERAKVLKADAPWEENLKVIQESRFSRYPIVKGDQYVGMMHVKDIVLGAAPELAKMTRPLTRIFVALPLESALREMQRSRCQFALVAGPGNTIVGLITMEDILEELVGSITDEFEREHAYYLADILHPEGIRLNLASPDKFEALRDIMSALTEKDLGSPPDKAIQAVLERERAVSTNLGGGVAVPHGRLPELTRPMLLFGRSSQGIAFDPGGEPVRLIFVLLSPAGQPHVQVRVLARIAGMLASEYVRERLLVIDQPSEIKEVIRAADPHSLA